MRSVIKHIFQRSRLWMAGFFVLTIVVGGFLLKLEKNLKTRHTPNGILSLHLARTSDDALDVRGVWQEKIDEVNRIDVAIHSLKLDFLFLIAYGGLLIVIYIRERIFHSARGKPNYYLLLPLSLMIVDAIENFLCILFLRETIEWFYMMRILSLLKYWLVIANIVFMKSMLRMISDYAKVVTGLLIRFRIVVIALLVIYLALWKADQGQDLLVNLNATHNGVVVFMIIISVVAFLFWHIPKFLSLNTSLFVNGVWVPKNTWQWINALFFTSVVFNPERTSAGKIKYVTDSDFARTFGALAFLIPAFGILNVMEIFKIGVFYSNLWLLGSTAVVLFLLKENLLDNAFSKRRYRWLFYLYFLMTLVALIVFAILNNGDPPSLWYLFWALILLAGTFLIVVSIRRQIQGITSGIRIGGMIMYASIVISLLFVYYNFDPFRLATNIEVNYATLGVFLAGVVFYSLFFLWLILWGRSTEVGHISQRSRVNIAGIFIFVSLLTAILFDNRFHDVHLVDRNANEHWQEPPTLKSYIKNWLQEPARAKMIAASDSVHRYPIVIVNTYGGGIRAAAWTSLVIAHLDKVVSDSSRGQQKFQDHVFAYSGASGGTIGASVMCALRRQHQDTTLDALINFYKKDFLSPVVVGLIGRDYIASTLSVNWSDRARLQDSIWENHMAKQLSNTFYSAPITSVWDNTYDVPLLFANTANVEKGVKGIVAPVKIDTSDFPTAVPVMELIYNDEYARYKKDPKHRIQTLKLSTAAFMSARFPFISPASRIDENHHFLDGGIYENSGAETAEEVARVIYASLDTSMRKKLKIIIVSLSNSPPDDPRRDPQNLFEIAAPLEALVSNVDGNARHADERNRIIFGEDYFKLRPGKIDSLKSDSDVADKIYSQNTAILPLGWQLSRQALDRLKDNIMSESAKSEIDRLVKQIVVEKKEKCVIIGDNLDQKR